jgi:regulatory protein
MPGLPAAVQRSCCASENPAVKFYDLSEKGIDRDTAAEVVEELFAEDDDGENPELATARALVERQYAAKLAAGKRDQVAAALARRGFSHAVIREVLSDDE